MIEVNKGYNEDCIGVLGRIPDNSIHIICIDPPYLYLKGQKLERPFDERLFFSECKRVLKKDGFLIMFGRGASFYRWNTICDDIGLTFKEEIVWDKCYNSSPVTPINRKHETISIYGRENAKINVVRIPYIEAKEDDWALMMNDVGRIKTTLNNATGLDELLEYASTKVVKVQDKNRTLGNNTTVQTAMMQQSRGVKALQAITTGMKEFSIIKIRRDHYNTIHPTQKPVRLLERLIALTYPKLKDGERCIGADFFGGSFSFAEACINIGIDWIVCEIDEEYYDAGVKRISALNNNLFGKAV